MAERVLGVGLRVLLAIIGVVAVGAGLIVTATELRFVYLGSPRAPSLLAALVAGVVALSGSLLIRGAIRGRIAVRSPRRG